MTFSRKKLDYSIFIYMEELKKLVAQILGDLEGEELSERLEELIEEIVTPYLNKLPKPSTDE